MKEIRIAEIRATEPTADGANALILTGRPILYGTTQDFLLYFGLSSLNDLPPFDTGTADENEEEMRILKE